MRLIRLLVDQSDMTMFPQMTDGTILVTAARWRACWTKNLAELLNEISSLDYRTKHMIYMESIFIILYNTNNKVNHKLHCSESVWCYEYSWDLLHTVIEDCSMLMEGNTEVREWVGLYLC